MAKLVNKNFSSYSNFMIYVILYIYLNTNNSSLLSDCKISEKMGSINRLYFK